METDKRVVTNDRPLTLDQKELEQSGVMKILAHLTKRQDFLRRKNDVATLDIVQTSLLRGQILECKALTVSVGGPPEIESPGAKAKKP